MTADLAPAIRSADAAWRDWNAATAHLVIAGRATCGPAIAPIWARERLREWLDGLTDEDLDAMGDALEVEARVVEQGMIARQHVAECHASTSSFFGARHLEVVR